MSLEPVSKLVTRHSASPAEIQKRIDRAEAEKIIVSRMFNWIMWGMIIMGIGIVMIVVNKSFDFGKWFKMISSIMTLGGAGFATAGVLNSMRQGVQLSGRRSPIEIAPTPEPPTLADGKALPTNEFPDAPASVTERTTQLISGESSATDKHRYTQIKKQ
jgi:hypothetical protein